jgi:predicted dehydrogenase
MATLNIGIIGAGGMGKVHAAAYRKLPEVAVAVVADTDRARGEAVAAEFGAQYVADYQAMFDRVDAVSVCLPHTLHRAAWEAAAAAGKHILCEKPLATTVADCAAIVAAARSAHVLLMIGLTHRFLPENMLVKDLLDAGAIGDVVMAQDTILAGVPAAGLGWRGTLALAGGGVFMDNGVHAVDRLRWWLGSDVVWVAGRVANRLHISEGEDTGQALLAYANGAQATVTQSRAVARPASTSVTELVGTQGVIRVHSWGEVQIARAGATAWETVPVTRTRSGHEGEIAEFVAAVREGRPPSVSGEDGAIAVETVLAIYRASERGVVVHLPLQ